MRARPRSRAARTAFVVIVVAAAVALPGVASAHVTVHPDRLPRGATDVELTFRCPNERSNTSSVKLQVFLPLATPLLGVLTDPDPGWKASTTTVTLGHPVHTDDGEVTSAVSEVTWVASGGGIPPGQYGDFTIAVGTMPDVTGPIVFKALQTYGNGEVVRWIQMADSLDENPTTPAPVLTMFAPTTAAGSSSDVAEELAVAALIVAVAAVIGVVLLATRRRRA